MKDHLHSSGLLEPSRSEKPRPKEIWEERRRLFAWKNAKRELDAVRLGSKTRVAFTSSPGYASMPHALQFVNAVLILVAESSGLRMLLAVPNRKLEPKSLKFLKSERAAAWAEVSQALRGFFGR